MLIQTNNKVISMTSNTKRKLLLLIMITFSISLFGCGGGGDTSEVNAEPTSEPVTTSVVVTAEVPDYSADADKLSAKAETSLDLFVETDFNFNSFRKIDLDINVQSFAGDYITDSLVYISSIDVGIVALDDPRIGQKSLIAVTKTDIKGHSLISFEAPQTVNNLLIEINALGVNNKHIIDINNQDYVVLNLN